MDRPEAQTTDRKDHSMPEKPLIKTLRGEVLERPPFWFLRQAGRYLPEYRQLRQQQRDFLSFCYSPDMAIEATLQPLRRFAPDAAILFSDILVVVDALGRSVRFVEGEGPVVDPVRSSEDVASLRSSEGIHDRLGPVYQTVRGLRRELPETTALIGFAGAPWTVALYMVEGRGGTDGGTARAWGYVDVDGFGRLIHILTDATVAYLGQQIEHGAEVVQLFDSWAGVLSETQFRNWVVKPTTTIVRALNERYPDVPVIGYPRGAGAQYETYVAETRVNAVGLDSGVPLRWVASTLQAQCTVQGSLDNQALVAGGAAMDAEADQILDILGSGPLVFNLGHGILPHTPPEHVQQLADRVRAWRRTEGIA